jgi:hypothetical protein
MAQNPVEPSEKIGLMQASKVLDWNQLIDKRRYRDIKNRLKDVV